MDKTFQLIFLIWISSTGVFSQYFSPHSPLSKDSAVSAAYSTYESSIHPMCVTREMGQQGRIFPTGQSMENLIALIERLEMRLENDTDSNLRQPAYQGADNVAKLLLRRFRFDGYDPDASSSPWQKSRDNLLTKIADAFFSADSTANDQNYYFPDNFFNEAELCSLYYMLSHNVYNTETDRRIAFSAQRSSGFRGKRQAYGNRQQQHQQQQQYPQQNYGNYGKQSNNQNIPPQNRNQLNRQYAPPNAVQSGFLDTHPIREEGVVSFRGNQDEAIAPARVLIGVIAGLSTDVKTSTKAVLEVLNSRLTIGFTDQTIDPLIALTIADLWGVAVGKDKDEKNYYYGLKGQWTSCSCATHYALTEIPITQYPNATKNMKATKAELRGGLDGYLIGKNLKSLTQIDTKSLRLSAILRSYYSKPKTQKSTSFTVTYCNRDQGSTTQDILPASQAYATIMNKYTGGSDVRLLGEFTAALQAAQQKENSNGFTDYCTQAPGGVLDKSAPCETPSDVIYIIDGTSAEKMQNSAKIVSLINGNLVNIGSYGGKVSIFANSPGQNSINTEVQNNQLPKGPEQWPLVPMAFNSSSTGYAQCRINDFNTTTLTPVPNTAKYFKYLNQTLFFYEAWNPNMNISGAPGKTAVLIDYDSLTDVPESGSERNDYNYFKDQLRYRHRDVKFLTLANKQDLFKDIIREDTDKESVGNFWSAASTFSKKICENPATFQWIHCNDKTSDNIQYVGFVTPGYKQNWAMYPEYFLKSFDVYFKVKAEDGEIKVCYDRWFPPERQDNCQELKTGEERSFHVSNPCKGKTLSSCDPFYFTVWGKDRTNNHCLDPKCRSLDQVKFTVTHSGVQCSSSNHLLPSTAFQLISLSIVAILYLFFNK